MPDMNVPPVQILPPGAVALELPGGEVLYGDAGEQRASSMEEHELEKCWVKFSDGARLPMARFIDNGGGV